MIMGTVTIRLGTITIIMSPGKAMTTSQRLQRSAQPQRSSGRSLSVI
jgi:hypothetical protein